MPFPRRAILPESAILVLVMPVFEGALPFTHLAYCQDFLINGCIQSRVARTGLHSCGRSPLPGRDKLLCLNAQVVRHNKQRMHTRRHDNLLCLCSSLCVALIYLSTVAFYASRACVSVFTLHGEITLPIVLRWTLLRASPARQPLKHRLHLSKERGACDILHRSLEYVGGNLSNQLQSQGRRSTVGDVSPSALCSLKIVPRGNLTVLVLNRSDAKLIVQLRHG